MGLINDLGSFFAFLRDFWGFLPVAVRLVGVTAFGGIIFISVMKGVKG